MTRILQIPSEITEYELDNKKTEVIILHRNMERLNIKYAPSLKKIVNFSDYIIFGPEKPEISVPALNCAENLNEIITFGYIQFNTEFSVNGISKKCAWVGTDNFPPTLTSVGYEYFGEFPCYYYDSKNSILSYAYPLMRECKNKNNEIFIEYAINNPNIVTTPILKQFTFKK